jgi:hypothetical protein
VIITCDERIDKAIPTEVMEALLTCLERYGVPEAHRLRIAHTQKELLRQLLAYYREKEANNVR